MNIKRIIRRIGAQLGYYSKPDFIIVGTQKGGTKALFEILNQHPMLFSAKKKELHYFDQLEWREDNNHVDYHLHFPPPYKIPKRGKVFEATPSYLYKQDVPRRLYKYNKALKIVILLRNPVKRAFSAWSMYHHHFNQEATRSLYDPREFNQAIREEMLRLEETNLENDHWSYVKRGIYHEQIERYFQFFSKENVLLINSEELYKNHDQTIKKILDFVDVPNLSLNKIIANERQLNEEDKYTKALEELKAFYTPHNQRLWELIEKNYGW